MKEHHQQVPFLTDKCSTVKCIINSKEMNLAAALYLMEQRTCFHRFKIFHGF